MKTEATIKPPIRRGDVDYSADAERLIVERDLRPHVEWMAAEIAQHSRLAFPVSIYVNRDREPDGQVTVAATADCRADMPAVFLVMIGAGQQVEFPDGQDWVDFEIHRREGADDPAAFLVFEGGPDDGRPYRLDRDEVPGGTFAFPKTRARARATYRRTDRLDDRGRIIFEFKAPRAYTAGRG